MVVESACLLDIAEVQERSVPVDEICMHIPEKCFKHPYMTIAVQRSSNSFTCNRKLLNFLIHEKTYTISIFARSFMVIKKRWRLGLRP